MVLEIDWPLVGEKIFTFRVNRFAQAEHNAAFREAEGQLVERGVSKDDPDYGRELNFAFMDCLADKVQRHIKSWTHHVLENPEPFSPAALKGIFDEMSPIERIGVGAAYVNAAEAHNRESEKNDTAPAKSSGQSS